LSTHSYFVLHSGWQDRPGNDLRCTECDIEPCLH